jgi:hypothetical protein
MLVCGWVMDLISRADGLRAASRRRTAPRTNHHDPEYSLSLRQADTELILSGHNKRQGIPINMMWKREGYLKFYLALRLANQEGCKPVRSSKIDLFGLREAMCLGKDPFWD